MLRGYIEAVEGEKLIILLNWVLYDTILNYEVCSIGAGYYRTTSTFSSDIQSDAQRKLLPGIVNLIKRPWLRHS